MSSTLITAYLGQGTAAARPATPTLATGTIGWYYATDTGVLSYYANGAWTDAATQSPPFHPGYSSLASARFWYPATATSIGGNNTATGKLFAAPFYSPVAQTFTKMGISMATSSTGSARLGVYNDNAGQPGSLLLDAGTVTYSATSGLQQISSLTIPIPKGWSWLAYTGSATMGVQCTNTNILNAFLMGSSSGTSISVAGGYSGSFVYGALPSTFPTPLTAEIDCPAPSLQF
jgi:hypothetical protein